MVNFRISIFRAMSGFVIASFIGIPLGLLLGGWFRKLKLALDVLLEVCSQINPFLMFHLVVLFFGIGEFSKISILVWTCLWPIIFSTISGINNVNPQLVKVGRTFGLGRVSMFIKIVLPATAPGIFNGLRLAAGYSLLMLTAAEMMGSKSGLGYIIINSQENFRITEMYAAVLIIAFVALIVDYIMVSIEKRFVIFESEGIVNSNY
ncbi:MULTISPECIES: ABC transporter permease subunit [unclassified Clostridium]|uniref:ABC transporter permease n=1 Tax=unclassified Clostridium TaxID=2614128 RepID=UPI00030F2A8C|nr:MULTISPECIES: ABC transporter permease subunit [unclassified Clostridium]